MKKPMWAMLLAAGALFSAQATAFSSLVVIGDSLSDSGNNTIALGGAQQQVITGNTYVPSHPYLLPGEPANALKSYSDGAVWVNAFAAGIGLPAAATPSLLPGGANFAFGGARTVLDGANPQNFPPSATTQLAMYLGGSPTVAADSLFVIAVGGNDVRDTVDAVQANPANAAAIIGAAAQSFAAGVDSLVNGLQAAGAGTIIVWTAPDVGKTPYALTTGGQAGAAFVSSISAAFNGALGGAMADEIGESDVRIFDIFGTVNGVVAAPAAFGLNNVTDACGALGAACDPSTYLFWDGIHPTSAGHALIASAMLQVAAVPEPGSVLMMAFGLAGLLVVRRRRS